MVDAFAVQHVHNRFARAYLKAFPKQAFLAAHTWADLVPPQYNTVICLSFDCDTNEDTAAIPQLIDLLSKYNMPASFALIGEWVQEAPEIHKGLVDAGHEIMNHGYTKHTDRRSDGSFYSSMFYHQLSEEKIQDEIHKNHQCLQDVLQTEIKGFRTPHFSTFQQPNQRLSLYTFLKEMGYTYSSSVTAIHQKTAGLPSYEHDIWEIPLTGCWGDLRSPFDSWGLIAAPDRRYQDEDFAQLFDAMLNAALGTTNPILLNIYVDPAHVITFPGFHHLLQSIHAARDHLGIYRYTDLIHACTHSQNG